ncbi:apoptosis-inducing factor 1, mitochondrial [Macrosteles quadrilineatus]|uniref:apoptosis-inducing factor 1, mitochondrial n=1 Tax=Macrosteles quadrilineatus TaxID=74068 RepID=UPI0023E2A029|nr:apoptosis-inducing factor 1, mitochondrial [Macrosteles quadrilineatus]
MLRQFTKYLKPTLNQISLKNGLVKTDSSHMCLRLYAAGSKRNVDTISASKRPLSNLMKNSSPETGKAGANVEKPEILDSGNDNPGGGDKKKPNIVLYLSPIIAAAVIYQLWSMFLKEEKKEPVSQLEVKRKKRQASMVQKTPASSADIPSQVPYLLIGGGTASFAAFRAIKSNDPTAQILVISNEPYYPYMRPPLSKEMFYDEDRVSVRNLKFRQWNGKQRSLFYEHDDFYADVDTLMSAKNGGISVARGWNVTRIDPSARKAYLEDGKEITYRKCLIATGAKPKTLPVFENASEEIKEKVMLYRNIYDFEELEDIIDEGAKSIAIVGGGFLGSELACALARRGKSTGLTVHQIFREDGNMGKVLPEYLCKWTTEKVKTEGVDVINRAEVSSVEMKDGRVLLKLNNDKQVEADQVIVAVGVEPNTQLAQTSDLEVDPVVGGYLVNAELEARSNLYIAGDCACFYDVKLGRRRIEHHDNAVVSGRLAGENMTGAGKPYLHQSMLWSDLGPDVGYEALGIVDSSLPTFGVYAKTDKQEPPSDDKKENKEEYTKGVIFYLRDEVIVGIVLWNIFNRVGIARQVLKEGRKFDDLNEVAKLFDIHSN